MMISNDRLLKAKCNISLNMVIKLLFFLLFYREGSSHTSFVGF